MTHYSFPTIGCIGAGNMGLSIIKGLLLAGVPPQNIMLSNRNSDKLNLAKKNFNITITTNNQSLICSQKIIILAVKPQDLIPLLRNLGPLLPNPSPVFISIAAGVRINVLSHYLPKTPIIRVMPNTAMQYQCSATGLYAPCFINQQHKIWAEKIFKTLGTITWVSTEDLLDTVTAVAGSGPAYFYLFMDYWWL